MSETRVIPTLPGNPFPLGRHVEHDDRSRGFLAPKAAKIPNQVLHRHYGPTLDQTGNSCTGNAMVNARNTFPTHASGDKVVPAAVAEEVYSLATNLDEFPGGMPQEDTGSSGNGVCKAAMQMRLISSYTWAFGFDEALAALALRPVLFGTDWYENMFYPAPDGVVTAGGAIAGGHEWCAIGYSVKRQMIEGINSWGRTWGLSGRFWVPFSLARQLLTQGGDVAVPIR